MCQQFNGLLNVNLQGKAESQGIMIAAPAFICGNGILFGLLVYKFLIHLHEFRHTVCLGHVFHREAIRLHHGTVISLVGFA